MTDSTALLLGRTLVSVSRPQREISPSVSVSKSFLDQQTDALLRATLIHTAVVVLTVLWVQPASALQESRQLYEVAAVRVDEAPVLDGVLDDAVWQRASVIDQFVQQEPEEGAPATERTEVLILYHWLKENGEQLRKIVSDYK